MPLYLVASPIGNLADLSTRAIDTLASCDLVAAEDTRRTGRLLAGLGIRKPLLSVFESSEAERIPTLVAALERGESVALISDAGTPLISDPGFKLVRSTISAGHAVIPIPGPSAVLAALAASGLPTDRFRFEGFIPRTDAKRRALFERLGRATATSILFESPRRLLKSLAIVARVLPERPLVVARELTKRHEEILRGTASTLVDVLSAREAVRGEVTLLLGGAPGLTTTDTDTIDRHIRAMREEGLPPAVIRRLTARLLRLSKKDVWERMEALSKNDANLEASRRDK